MTRGSRPGPSPVRPDEARGARGRGRSAQISPGCAGRWALVSVPEGRCQPSSAGQVQRGGRVHARPAPWRGSVRVRNCGWGGGSGAPAGTAALGGERACAAGQVTQAAPPYPLHEAGHQSGPAPATPACVGGAPKTPRGATQAAPAYPLRHWLREAGHQSGPAPATAAMVGRRDKNPARSEATKNGPIMKHGGVWWGVVPVQSARRRRSPATINNFKIASGCGGGRRRRRRACGLSAAERQEQRLDCPGVASACQAQDRWGK